MTRYGTTKVTDISIQTVAHGGDKRTTPWLPLKDICEDAVGLGILAPATLDVATYTIEVSDTVAGTVARTLCGSDGTTALAVPAAGKACDRSEILGAVAFRIKQSADCAADRTFTIVKQFVM